MSVHIMYMFLTQAKLFIDVIGNFFLDFSILSLIRNEGSKISIKKKFNKRKLFKMCEKKNSIFVSNVSVFKEWLSVQKKKKS